MAYPGKIHIFMRQPNHPTWSCDHRRDVLNPETSPYVPCPACRNQARGARRHWQGFALACFIAFVLTWLGLAASCGGAR